jgi:diguanylate cyclase (GGDEF)-like protein/PAS domain S-box-containing protein
MLYVSPAATGITGYQVDDLITNPMLLDTIICPEDQKAWREHRCKADAGHQDEPLEFRIQNRSGQIRWIRHTCRTIVDENGMVLGVRGSNRDITERKEARLLLQRSEEQFRLITATAHDAIVMFDDQRLVTYWNRAASQLFGMAEEEAIGKPIALFFPGVVDAIHREGGIPDGGFTLELTGMQRDGKRLQLESAISYARFGYTFNTILASRDISDRKQHEERLTYVSQHDALTGLFNRAGFEEHLARLNVEGPFPVAIIVADLDGLKLANDTGGHEAGDRLLQATGSLLASSFRANDVVARIGGDEFAVLLPGMAEEMAQAKYERMLRRIELFSELPENPQVSISCGLAIAYSGESLLESIKKADQLMYHQKQRRKQLHTGAMGTDDRISGTS